jgi:hypothetical protein
LQTDDAFTQQVQDFLAATFELGRLVGGEHVVEAAVLADDHDDVFDR